MISRSHAATILLTATFVACTGEVPDPKDDDTIVVETDGEYIDLDGSLEDAAPLTVTLDASTAPSWLNLLPARDAIDPAGDRDFFTIELTEGVPYHFWVDTQSDLLCDTLLWIYPPGADTERNLQIARDIVLGDVIAESDDMPYRIAASDPAILFVPPSTGTYTLQVIQYGDATGGAAEGGPWCDYMLRGLVHTLDEVECNDDFAVRDALAAASAGDTGFADDAVSPAVQPIATSLFDGVDYATNVKLGERLSGQIDFDDDNDVWRFRFGDLSGQAGGHYWLWSLWDTQPTSTDVREHQLTLFDANMQVLARTNHAVPDGYFGFTEDAGIVYPVQPNTTYYLRVSATDDFDVIEPEVPVPDRTDGIEPWEMLPDDLVITEVMVNATDCIDDEAQYIEVYNTTPYPIFIAGLTLEVGGDTFVPLSATSATDRVQAGAYMVLMRAGSSGAFCYSAFPIYFTFGDRNVSVGPIRLVADGNEIDSVDVSGWDVPTGASLQLRPEALAATPIDNELFDNWCVAVAAISSSGNDRGTPALPNDCPALVDTDTPEDTDAADTDPPVDTDPADTDPPIDTDPADTDTDAAVDTFQGDTDPPIDSLDTDPGGFLPGTGAGAPSFYSAMAHGYGNDLVGCSTDGEGTQLWLEREGNDDASDANLLRFCAVGSTSLYVSRVSGFFSPSGLSRRFVPVDLVANPNPSSSDVARPCGDGTSGACPDADYFVIRQTSGAGPIAGKRLTLQVQAKTVGSFALPDIYVFGGTSGTIPLASSADLTAIAETAKLSAPDPVVQFDIPDEVSTLTILIAPRCVENDAICGQFYLHGARTEANAWFLRAMIEDVSSTE